MSHRYVTYVCGDGACPNNPQFEHRFYFGCVPKDFSERTGRSKTHRQYRVDEPDTPGGYRYRWNGGCDASEPTP